ncbi:LacI family DNA-binding transcriptional regulator [Actinocorallia libanotica]|uniref:LacI family DNA-binding transcriptional regulator n=1 Tax=Actinocorallia libanotica TaxID=46162 RepID=A0ABN1QU31_9ACTN
MPQSGRRVTIRELARVTGLSPAAVSYALRGVHTSAETQKRVRAAADELGYQAHPIARALASGRTDTVGLLCGSLADFWQQELAVRIGRALLEEGRYAIVLDAADDPGRELELAERLRDQRVDGLIVQPVDPSAPAWAQLADVLPVVSIGDALAGNPHGEVVFDNRAGVTLALEHLHGLGHRRIGVLTSTLERTPDRPADVHVRAEARRLGLEAEIAVTRSALPEATAAARALLARPDRPSALFCFSDSIAYGVYLAAGELGLSVPGEVSVCGYDAHALSVLPTPPLTTVDWDLPGVAADAVSLVLDAIEERPPGRIVRPPVLCPRESTSRIPRRD